MPFDVIWCNLIRFYFIIKSSLWLWNFHYSRSKTDIWQKLTFHFSMSTTRNSRFSRIFQIFLGINNNGRSTTIPITAQRSSFSPLGPARPLWRPSLKSNPKFITSWLKPLCLKSSPNEWINEKFKWQQSPNLILKVIREFVMCAVNKRENTLTMEAKFVQVVGLFSGDLCRASK